MVRAWLVVAWLLHGERVCASRPDQGSIKSLAGSEKKGRRVGTMSFLDLVALHPRPEIPPPRFPRRPISPPDVEVPDMCPGGQCEVDVVASNRLSHLAVESSDTVMRVSLLGSRQLDEGEQVARGYEPYHPQLFVETPPDKARWGYLFLPGMDNADCEDNLIFRSVLEEGDDNVSVTAVREESGAVVQTIDTTTGSQRLRENAEGTTAHYDANFGPHGVHADVWRTALTTGCAKSGADCDPFKLPADTNIIDVSLDQFMSLLDGGGLPAGDYCARHRASSELVQRPTASSELVQLSTSVRAIGAMTLAFGFTVGIIIIVLLMVVLPAVKLGIKAGIQVHRDEQKRRRERS